MFSRLFGPLRRKYYQWLLKHLPDPSKCEHQWKVYSTAQFPTLCLQLQCEKCGALGSILDPSEAEWARAFNALSQNYAWPDAKRVVIGSGNIWRHVMEKQAGYQ
jgi:hypothetical protein